MWSMDICDEWMWSMDVMDLLTSWDRWMDGVDGYRDVVNVMGGCGDTSICDGWIRKTNSCYRHINTRINVMHTLKKSNIFLRVSEQLFAKFSSIC